MAVTSSRSTRRLVLAAGLALASGQALAARQAVVTILGDSITAGYGLPARDALPAQLQIALAKLGAPALVRGAGVSGDTTTGGAARADFSVQPDTAVCVVALGGNDLLRGIEPAITRANLQRILQRLRQRRITAVLAGMRAPHELGSSYARDFDAIFPAVARANGVRLYPDLLRGIERTPSLNQKDGIHPNAAGARIIANGLAPVVAQALKSKA